MTGDELAPALMPDGKVYDHDCEFRRLLRLVVATLGAAQNAEGNYQLREAGQRLDHLIAVERAATALVEHLSVEGLVDTSDTEEKARLEGALAVAVEGKTDV